jgi:hypothetical protein
MREISGQDASMPRQAPPLKPSFDEWAPLSAQRPIITGI